MLAGECLGRANDYGGQTVARKRVWLDAFDAKACVRIERKWR